MPKLISAKFAPFIDYILMLFFTPQRKERILQELQKCHFLVDRQEMTHSIMPFTLFERGNYVNILSNRLGLR